jgi:acetyltransferase-like isoleucine patch superfamily enzyme
MDDTHTTSASADWRAFGHDVRIWPMAKVISPENVTMGSHIIIDDYVFLGRHENLTVGNHVHIASHVSVTGGGTTYLCDFVGLATGCRILSGTDDFVRGGLTGPTIPEEFRVVDRSYVTIGAHSVIGANAVVLPGVHVGEGTTVGACSVVTKDLEPWSVYVGAPARKVNDRDKENTLAAERAYYERHGPLEPAYRFVPPELLDR